MTPAEYAKAGIARSVERMKTWSDHGQVRLMATELRMIEKNLWLLEPERMKEAVAELAEGEARSAAGFCIMPGCQEPATGVGVPGDLCSHHDKEITDFFAENEECP